jgi:hypothetical protein
VDHRFLLLQLIRNQRTADKERSRSRRGRWSRHHIRACLLRLHVMKSPAERHNPAEREKTKGSEHPITSATMLNVTRI